MVGGVFSSKVEIFSNFFQLPNVRRSVKYDSSNLDLFLGLNFWLLVPFWLFNVFFLFDDLRSVGLLTSFVVNLAVYVNASN